MTEEFGRALDDDDDDDDKDIHSILNNTCHVQLSLCATPTLSKIYYELQSTEGVKHYYCLSDTQYNLTTIHILNS